MNNFIGSLMKNMPDYIDGVLIRNCINRRYFTGFSSTAGALLVTKKAPYMLLDFRYFEMAKAKIKDAEVVCFSDLETELRGIFEKDGVKNLAIEAEHTSVKQLKKDEKEFKNIEIITDEWLDNFILDSASVKSDEEIEKIKASQEVTDAAFSHILNIIEAGKTEKEIAFEIDKFILKNSEGTSFKTIVVSGKNTSLPHGVPSNKVIEPGDFVTMDFGSVLDGYCSDMTRTICIGAPSDFQRKLYSIVLEGQKIGLENVKAGARCKEVDGLVREFFKEYGYEKEFGHGLGHGVGLNIHEDPYLNKVREGVLKENMVVTVEPGIYIDSRMGLRIEDLVVVKDGGILNLTKSSKELISI